MNQKKIVINIHTQNLQLYSVSGLEYVLLKEYKISSGKNGVGCQEGTGQTPLGQHMIAEKIGVNEPANTVFVGRAPTGEIYSVELDTKFPNRDWILSRILWLSGTEDGINKGMNSEGCCDTYQRYIYIHGTPDNQPMGIPMSHGCIRMRNVDVIELFDLIKVGTIVNITDN